MDAYTWLKKYNCRIEARINHFDHRQYNKCLNTIRLPITSDTVRKTTFLEGTWQITAQSQCNGHFADITFTYKLLRGQGLQMSVSSACVVSDWSTENYVLMPGAVYNGNRFESRRIFYSPKLLDSRDIGPDVPTIISDVPRLNNKDGYSCIQERSGSMAFPSMGFFAAHKKNGFFMLTEQASRLGDYGYTISESRNRDEATFAVSAPLVREVYKYHITDNQYPSDDIPHDFTEGEEIKITFRIYIFSCKNIQSLFEFLVGIRNAMVKDRSVEPFIPFSSTFALQEKKFNTQNWVSRHGYYSVGMRENFLQDWQIGWTGGMISTYPLLFNGGAQTKANVLRNFDFLFPAGISPSGFFYDCGVSDPWLMHWYGGDIRRPHTKNWHLIRKSADALYYIVKQFMLMKTQGIPIKKKWEGGTRVVADAFVRLWDTWGQFGHFVDSLTGNVVVGGSSSAALAPAALMLAADYFQHNEYRRVAIESAEYFYHAFVCKGYTTGGPGDAMQNPDSESAYAMLESFAILFETTGDSKWLSRSREMANQFASWVMSYNYTFHNDCLLKRLKTKTVGSVIANTQNKHGSPGICTHSGIALLRLFRATGEIFYLQLLRDIAQHIPQLMSHPIRMIPGMKEGWITERVSTIDWFEGLGEIMYGSTWAETALMLTTVEIPAVYIQPDKHVVFAIDQIYANMVSEHSKEIIVELYNPTNLQSDIKILVENKKQYKKPLGENALLTCLSLSLGPKEKQQISIKK